MSSFKFTGAVLLAGACLALGSMSANAADAATRLSCTHTAGALQDAMNANSNSPNYEAAVQERRTGFEYCNAGMYQKGVDHYSQAIKLLSPVNADNGKADSGKADNS